MFILKSYADILWVIIYELKWPLKDDLTLTRFPADRNGRLTASSWARYRH